MSRRHAIQLGGAIALFVFLTASLDAGGWAVVTVVKTPDTVLVGTPITVMYAVRQHGQHLLSGLHGRIEARFGETVVQATSSPLSEDGYYAATLTLPRAGTWTLDIVSGFNTSAGRAAVRAVVSIEDAPALSPIVRGGRLFVSKGCVTCHLEGMSAAPALKASGYDADYLTQFLRRPSVRATTVFPMPNLGLDEAEIAALVAFLNGRQSSDGSITKPA